MNTKTMAIVGCLLLLAVVVAPTVVVGHSERAAIFGDQSGYGFPSARVSGRYVGGAGPAIAQDAYINPPGTLAIGAMLCDAEVVIDSLNFLANEVRVDGAASGGSPNTWDDGGAGGACHTDHYTTTQFNTVGCYAGVQAHAGTHTGANVWIGASCDWKEDQGGTSSLITFLVCLINEVLAFNPLVILGPPTPDLAAFLAEVQTFIDCSLHIPDCFFDPTCGPTGATEICGADGKPDAINYGYGDLGIVGSPAPVFFPAATGIVNPPPGVTGPCPDGPASVFVFDTIATNFGNIECYPALTGEVWS